MLVPIGLSLALALAATPPAPLLPHPIRVEHLDNGFTWVTIPFDSPGVVAYFTLVRAGSRDEVEPGKSGYAHLFEHLMFRGTEKVSAEEYERRMQALGADTNASTSPDYTLFVPSAATDALPELVALDADRFQHLSYARAAYVDETGAVLGEYNKSAASPRLPMQEALRELAFTRHTYGHTTLGSKRDVVAMPGAYDYSRAFWRRFYTPDDCVLFVAGDFDAAKVSELVHREYGSWTGKRAATHVPVEPEQTAPRFRALTWKAPTPPRLLEGFRIPAGGVSLADDAALMVAASVALGESSPLYQRLVVAEQKVLDLSFGPELSRDPGLLTVSARLGAGTSFDEVIAAVDAALASVGRGEATAAQVEAVQRHLLNAQAVGLQTPQAVAGALARWTAVTGDPGSFEAYVAALAAVTPSDVARAARTHLIPAHRSVVTLARAPVAAGDQAHDAAHRGAK